MGLEYVKANIHTVCTNTPVQDNDQQPLKRIPINLTQL